MKKLMNRAGLLAAAFALALAVALALNAAGQTPATAQVPAATHTPTATQTPAAGANASARGSDTDDNWLIEITTPEQLNAIRWDLNGDGAPDEDTPAADIVTYNNILECPPTSVCKGYELKSDISLADYPTWDSIGPWWGAVFDGSGFSITGLRGNNGLFMHIATGAVVKNVDVVGAVITPLDDQGGNVGALAAVNVGTIIGCYVTGEIIRNATAKGDIGGLVGRNQGAGKIYASVADVNIKVTSIPAGYGMRVGGLVGVNVGAIHRSYAYGNVRDARTNRDREADNPGRFNARGLAVNQTNHRGTIHSSISYGNKIVTYGDGESAIVDTINSEYPARFAYLSARDLTPDSCHLADEWEFTCPTPTPTSTPTPTPTD